MMKVTFLAPSLVYITLSSGQSTTKLKGYSYPFPFPKFDMNQTDLLSGFACLKS